MRTAAIFGIAFVAITFMSASATIINIPDDYPTIQEGIDASADGDTVLVQPGTYVENINFNGHDIVLGSLFLTFGDTSYIAETIIDGDSAGSVVTIASEENNTTIISGFTIRNGFATLGGGIYCQNSQPNIVSNHIIANSAGDTSGYTGFGGGIYCMNADAVIRENIIFGNVAYHSHSSGGRGGGIYCDNSDADIIENVISRNIARWRGGGIYFENSNGFPYIFGNEILDNLSEDDGGGIFVWDSNPEIRANNLIGNYSDAGGGIYCLSMDSPIIENNFLENAAGLGGGGLHLSGSQNTLIDNVFRGNMSGQGGGIQLFSSNLTSTGNVFVENFAGTSGGALYLRSSAANITNCTFSLNRSSGNYGGGIYLYGSDITLTNTILWADSANIEDHEIHIQYSTDVSITYSDIDGGWEGQGNIDCDPLFCYPEYFDYRLAENSCCIGSGESGANIGALGVGCEPTEVSQISGILPDKFELEQNYPNPFNVFTVIRFNLPVESHVRVKIYDLSGRLVEILINNYKNAGYHRVTWEAADFPSGVYFARLETEGVSENIKLVLLK